MKIRLVYFSCVLFVGMLLFGCSKSSDPDPTPQQSGFSVDQSTLSIPEGTSLKVKVTAPTGAVWTVNNSGLNWLTISGVSTTGGSGEFTVTVSKNTYREVRTATVTVVTADTKIAILSRTIQIKVTSTVANTAPTAPATAVYPANGAKDVQETYLRLQWSDAADAEKDKVTYVPEYSTDQKTWTKNVASTETPSCTFLFKLAVSTTYYWRVVAKDIFGAESAASPIFSFTTASEINAWKNGEVRLFQNNGNGSADAFTLIVTGDGFSASEMAPGGNWDNLSLTAINGLFENTEPYKTYRSYVRVYRIGAISAQTGISQHQNGDQTGICTTIVKTRFGSMYDNVSSSTWTGMFDNVSPSTGGCFNKVFNWVDSCMVSKNIHVEKNYAVLVIQNVSHYSGSVNYFWENGKNRTLGFVCNSPGSKGTQTGFENVVTHEIGGHAIGHLADLYQTVPTATLSEDKRLGTLECQSYGWYGNVDVSGDKTKSPWAHILSSAEYSTYYSLVGYFEGARSVGKGIWRAESFAGCMNENQFYFDAASRYSIVKQLKQCAGETLTWADFVRKDYDHGNAIISTKSATIPANVPRLPEPVVWR